MSDYVRKKVIRYPITKAQKEAFMDIEMKLEKDGFQIAQTYPECFLDFVIDDEYGADGGDWGKVRTLYDQEVLRYESKFQKFIPDLISSKLRLVEYCWYNCSEAPSYYDETTHHDSFFDEV